MSYVSITQPICTIAGDTVSVLSIGLCAVTASQPSNDIYAPAENYTQHITIVAGPSNGPRIAAVSNAASYAIATVAPASYVALFGSRLQPSPAVTLRDPSGLDRVLEVLYAGETQINFLLPTNVGLGQGAVIVTTSAGRAEYSLTISATAPGLFSANGSGQGLAAAQALIVIIKDKSISTLTVADGPIPVRDGTEIYLALYGTGIRGHGPGVSATIGGRLVEVLYAGPQGGFPGLDQVNLRVPLSAGGLGNVEIRLTVDGVIANAVTANFQ